MTRAITFGRAPAGETHIHVDDKYCSPKHCMIEQRGNRCWVSDLGSTNGTWIVSDGDPFGIRVDAPMMLLPGHKVRIGRTTLPWEAR